MLEDIHRYLQYNTVWAGVLIIAFGLFMLLASIFNWHFIFGNINESNYNLEKIDGWVNLFGQKTARVVFGMLGVVVIGGGSLWLWINL